MKKLGLGQTIGILANIGVVAGILFLAYEIQQNNKFLAAQARSVLTSNRISASEMNLLPENLSALLKARNGEELSAEENYRLELIAVSLLVRWEAEYNEFEAGMFTMEALPVEGYRSSIRSHPSLLEVWELRKSFLHPGFVQFMEENVVNER